MTTLLTNKLRRTIPSLYATECLEPKLKNIVCTFFTPWSNWTWYVIEFDGDDLFWGLVDGLEVEFGYFSLKELERLTSPFGLSIERDIYFESRPVGDLMEKLS